MCSCTMSGNKHHFEDLREGPTPKTVGGIGDSTLKIAGIGTFIYNIMDEVKYNERGNRLTMVKKAVEIEN